MNKELKKCQTTVKHTKSFDQRLSSAIVSDFIPRSVLFLSIIEFAVELAEKEKMRLEDVPAFLRKRIFLPNAQVVGLSSTDDLINQGARKKALERGNVGAD